MNFSFYVPLYTYSPYIILKEIITSMIAFFRSFKQQKQSENLSKEFNPVIHLPIRIHIMNRSKTLRLFSKILTGVNT